MMLNSNVEMRSRDLATEKSYYLLDTKLMIISKHSLNADIFKTPLKFVQIVYSPKYCKQIFKRLLNYIL